MFTASMGLTACGGSSSGTDTSITLSGVVADGYLGNATVCLDLNNNKQCDASEPSATTADDGTGSYSLQATAEQRDNNPILVVVTTESTDTDLNGGTVAKPFKLSAPAGKTDFISPITTMVQAELDQNPGYTTSQAEGAVKNKLGLSGNGSVDLFANFIEESDTSEDYKALYQTAQILARVKGELTETLTTTFENAGIALDSESQKDLEKMVMEFALAQLSAIHTEAKTEIELNGVVSVSKADEITLTVDKTAATSLDATGLEAKIAEYDANESQTVNQATALVADGGLIAIKFDDNGRTTGIPNIRITTMLKEADGQFQMYEARGFSAFWLDNYSDEQAAKQDATGAHKDSYRKYPLTVGSEGQLVFNGKESQIDIHSIVEKPLAGTTVRLREIQGFYYNTDFTYGTTLENSNTVTFQEGDIEYQYAYTETPITHLENLSTSSYAALCSVEGRECSPNAQNATTLAEFREVIHGSYDPSEGLVHLVDPNSYEVTSCSYVQFSDTDFNPKLGEDGKPYCSTGGPFNEIEVLGKLATGTLSDGNTYFTTPLDDYGDSYGEIPYRVYINNVGTLMKNPDNFYANGEERFGVFKAYNLSAAKRIYGATTQ